MADRRATMGFVARAGHLAVWLGLYCAAAYVAAVLVLHRAVIPAALAAAFCAGVGLYLFDRVKVLDRWLEPADPMAQPGRFAFLLKHRRLVRAVAWSVLAAGAVAVAAIDARNLVLPPIGLAGILAYSRVRPGGVRPKDVLGVKNLLPGLAIGGLGVILAWQSPGGAPASPGTWWFLTGGLVLVITADAALCDLDDAEADAAHGTSTVTTLLGRRWTWAIALAAHAVAGAGLVVAGALQGRLREPGLLAGTNLAATLILCGTRPGSVRDLIDLKLPLVVAVAWVAR